jgi:hypothetical protein
MRTTADLIRALATKGFTPGERDLPQLVALVAEEHEVASAATRALVQRSDGASAVLVAALRVEDPVIAPRLLRVLGQCARAGSQVALDALLGCVAASASSPRSQRAAMIQLGKVGGDLARAALLARWDQGGLGKEEERALVEALGKVGGAEARARVTAAAAAAADPEMQRLRTRSLLMIDRDDQRDEGIVDVDAPLPEPWTATAGFRRGLEPLVLDELRELGLSFRDGSVPGVATGPAGSTLRALASARTLTHLGFRVDLAAGDVETAVANAMCADRTMRLLQALTRGGIRWRLQFADGGHHRASIWRIAGAVQRRRPMLINDPKQSVWDVVVDEHQAAIELRPRRVNLERFAWRREDVPAASHPTIAAALARLGGGHDDDVVWDPFVGSGAELIERGRLAPFRHLIGSDIRRAALAAALTNLTAAGLAPRSSLLLADARLPPLRSVSLIITNPPLGRRVRGDAGALLSATVLAAGPVLAHEGRLAWITPAVDRTGAAARQVGLTLRSQYPVDVGGFTATMELWSRSPLPARTKKASNTAILRSIAKGK